MFPVIPRNNVNLSPDESLLILQAMFLKPTSSGDVRAFESAFAKFIGANHCIAFSSGSAALYHGLAQSSLKPGDEIIVPEYEFTTVIETIRLLGLVPVFARVEKPHRNVTLETVKEVFSEKVKGVLVAHIHGVPANIEPIANWCKNKKVLLIEDCAHSAGGKIGQRHTGTYGEIAVFSFGDGKNLVTCGGGMVATMDPDFAGRLQETSQNLEIPSHKQEIKRLFGTLVKTLLSTRLGFSLLLYPIGFLFLKIFGKNVLDRLFSRGPERFQAVPANYNLAMTDISGRLGQSQLARLEQLNQRRTKNGELIFQSLQIDPAIDSKKINDEITTTGLNLAFERDDANTLRQKLFKTGIDSRQDYLLFYNNDHPSGSLSDNIIYLPNHPAIEKKEASMIGGWIKRFISG